MATITTTATSTAYEDQPPSADGSLPTDRSVPAERSQRASRGEGDVEDGLGPPQYSDPYQLSSRLKSERELQALRASTARRYDGCGPLTLNRRAAKARGVQKFYESQNESIERFLTPVDEHIRHARQAQGQNQLRYQIAVRGSFIANVLLAGLQLYASISSGSLSLWTTMADAIFDPLSNVTLMISHRAVSHVDPRRFPSGKARIETAGNIVFCFIMTSVSFILIVVSAIELSGGNQSDSVRPFWFPSILVVCIAFATKLGLFLYCWTLRHQYSQVHILWEDHRNDLFINGFGILTSVGGSKLAWWIDPMGAILLSCLIAVLWLRTAYSEFQLLIGVTADTDILQWITYIAMTHSPSIKAIDTVRAYHSGPRIIVEVDIVMEPTESLRMAHDVAEGLQTTLESLPNVERAYVHIDYETSHKPEHFLKKEL